MTHRPDLRIDMEKEQQMSLLSIELSQERIRDAEREATRRRDVAQVRAMRRARRDAEVTAVRLRRLLTTR
ncbi:hypothetical protein NE236_31120 [Actinoallomurus purpureus]|uniref:hypothetical protein n=1 Tax=Actinoallomurus purpureus TaxID=478114 RepID=UPI00209339F0|nr:hypothetical protein [Actinoallomurus purpureus]MCO6009431.1 hypothetical protein [Actinoallomurus purpureus]